jgi:tetratricopeptide (TPR) repeat protein/tRNA A-37 threonylcarbamoyl transferase component Bud32
VVPFSPEPNERYTLTRLHARGGIGQVWLARDSALGREVALKELRPERANDPALWARFLEEARITGQLEHPSIVPVYELARRADDQYPFYTMRFVRGRTLTEATRQYHERRSQGRADPLELPTLLHAFGGLCQALAYAHSRGVIHRDLKGQNVVLGDFGEVMLLDWGLAKLVEAPEPDERLPRPPIAPIPQGAVVRDPTEAGQVLGTPAYMSPEQAAGRLDQVDRRSDVYGLGAILYEILAGQPPFSSAETEEVLRQVREDEPVPPRRLNAEAPPALEAVCRKAMAKSPDDRYPSATDLLREVQRFLADEPVEAYPEPLAVRAGRWARRHRTLVTGLAVLLLSAVAALSAGTVLVTRERDEARRQGRFARQAVDDMYTHVAEEWLADRSQMDSLQRQFLEKALDYYERFAQESSTDPAVRREKGQAHHRMGDILRKLGRHPDAERAYRGAIELLERLEKESPGEPRYRHELAHARNRLGIALAATGRRGEAEESYRLAMELQEALVAAQPGPGAAQYRHYLAKTHWNLASLLTTEGRHDDAEESFTRAVKLLEGLTGEMPAELLYSEDLGGCSLDLGRMLSERGRQADAAAAFRRATDLLEPIASGGSATPKRRELLAVGTMYDAGLLRSAGDLTQAEGGMHKALALYRSLAADYPDRPDYRGGVARAHSNLGDLLWLAGRLAEAETTIGQAVHEYEALIAADVAGATQNRLELAQCYNNLGLVLAAANRRREAEAAYRSVLRIDRELAAREPDVPQRRRDLGSALGNFGLFLADAGRPREAEAAFREAQSVFEQLVKDHPDVPDYRWALAWSLGLVGSLQGPDAETAQRRAVDLYVEIVRAVPHMRDYRVGLVQASNNLGDFLDRNGRGRDAEALCNQTVSAAEALVRDFPGMPDYQGLLGQVLGTFGVIKQHAGAHDEARRLLERSVLQLDAAMKKQPGQREHRAGLRDAHVNLARSLAALARTVGSNEAAENLTRNAVAHLQQAVTLGFTEVVRLEKDSDFGTLRSREDFRALAEKPPQAH